MGGRRHLLKWYDIGIYFNIIQRIGRETWQKKELINKKAYMSLIVERDNGIQALIILFSQLFCMFAIFLIKILKN